ETLLPIYKNFETAAAKHPKADVVVNFASYRSAFDSSMEALNHPNIRTVCVIAEGVPERRARILAATAKKLDKMVIGPATVGGIKAGSLMRFTIYLQAWQCYAEDKCGKYGSTANNASDFGCVYQGFDCVLFFFNSDFLNSRLEFFV
ncbi:MAG: hypothetical protein HGA95_02010, partial [Caldiserica bacterium]|nr:hypothetical protein [Caldisericota bacterium]